MPKHRTPLPPEIKELIQLIRQGRLFEVQQWIKDGKPIRLPEEGHFIISPMLAAMRTGFHSMIEVLLEALKDEEDLDHLLYEAVNMARPDLIELTHRFGADPKSIDYGTIASTHNPLILRWFEDREVDLETDLPLAAAFRWRRRAALGTYMRFRKKMPQLQLQADMALRHHAGEGDLKWVCLLLASKLPPTMTPSIFTG